MSTLRLPAWSAGPTLPLVLLLAAAYLVAGRLALLLAIPPGFASSVWPAAGVALVALLLAGRRLWPGVMLGSFLVNLPSSFSGAEAETLTRAAAVAAAIGTGAALQALAGEWIVRRLAHFPNTLSQGRDIARFMIWGGPVSCLVSSSTGVATLYFAGVISAQDVSFHWWTWWVGDSIGVLVVAPLVLAFTTPADRFWRERRRAVPVPLLLTAAAVVVLFVFARDRERSRVELELGQRALSLAHAFEKHVHRSLDDLMSVEGLFASSDRVGRDQFAAFTRRILRRNPGFQALSWNPRVTLDERPAYEAAGRADGFPRYRFTERSDDGELRAAGERPEYVVVHFIEPYAGNEPALGYDVHSDPLRRQAIERARDSGALAVTSGIRLVQETGTQTGVLILAPVYAGGERPDTLDERQRALRGYATGVMRVGDTLRSALAGLPPHGFLIGLFEVGEGERLLASLGDGWRSPGPATPSWSFDQRIGGRLWRLRLAPSPASQASQRGWYAWLVLAGGLLLVSLLGALLLLQTGRTAELASLNAQLAGEIARRRQLETQREKLIGELEVRNSELERFSYAVSHDLKSPLTTIKGFLGLLRKDLDADDRPLVEHELDQLDAAADRMRALVDDLLELSRAGQVTGAPEPVELDDVVREAAAQVAGQVLEAGVEIAIADDLPAVMASRPQLVEVLQNLLANAAKFMGDQPAPRIEFRASVEGERVVCSVRDNGIGIEPEHRERIFGLFQRLHATPEGTGIGLALVRRIIERSGGSIWVESGGRGQGSTFYFTLPAAGMPRPRAVAR